MEFFSLLFNTGIYDCSGKIGISASCSNEAPQRFSLNVLRSESFMILQGKFFEGVGIGEMAQIVKETGTEKGEDTLIGKPCIHPLFGKADEEAPGKMVYAYGMTGPGMSCPRVDPESRPQLHDAVETHKGAGFCQGLQVRRKVNVAPEIISNGFGKT
jgi:hypothetical protein